MTTSTQLQNALAFITHMDNRDYPAMAATMSPKFTHRFLPVSLGGFGMPVRSKEQFLQHVKDLESVFEQFNFQPPLEVIEGKDVVILHLTTDGKTKTGKPYTNEYMFTFRFEPDSKGKQIISVKEFMDSQYVQIMLAGEKEAA
jgi:ketosteroid isomerase-like protein